MGPLFSHRLAVVLLQLLLGASVPSAASHCPILTSNQVFASQWQIFTSNLPRDWRGYWIRYYANGTIRTETNSTRKFVIPPSENEADPQKIIQTNTYTNPNWHANGDTVRQFLYENGNPPTYARRILPNGTLGPSLGRDVVYFRRRGDGIFIPTSEVQITTVFIFEDFLTHPRDSGIRLSLAPVYRNLQFSYAAFAREVDGAPAYPTRFWSEDRTARPVQALPIIPQPRFWRTTSSCFSKDYVLETTGVCSVTTGWTLPSQPKERMSILKLPDGVTLYYPTNLTDYNRREIAFMILWNVNESTAVKSVISLDLEGKFSKKCTTVFTKTGGHNAVQP